VRPLERVSTPFLDTIVSAPLISRADVVLAIFESQANALAFLRTSRVRPFRRPRLAVVSCWLAELLPQFSVSRRALYRRIYRSVDRVIYFSRNQTTVYRELLGVPSERLAFVPFGIDHRFFSPADVAEDFDVLAVGRDRGRDWATFFAALRGTSVTAKVACRPETTADQNIPESVEMLGVVDRAAYRDLTARARVVVIPTQELRYPTGQSVLLESMSMGKCCVVTDTPAIRDYVCDERTGLFVQPHSATSLQATIERAVSDASLRTHLGRSARASVERSFTQDAMWSRVRDVLLELDVER
jgi:glycosyltransferase involved in cell wall biosynthesis